ncbi:phosphotransferase [Nocardioides sp.]|uniref:phosphotransferase n=1 Tax=Nocardioides sp. TaxID=35761 RepID=UPI00286BB793|nr:phosphotransferase [Nocardioides sp.]
MDAARVADEFGLGRVRCASSEPVGRGRQGLVWRLETSEGRWAVKVAHGVVDEERLAAAAAFADAAVAAGVPTPAVRRTASGAVCSASTSVTAWVDLLQPDTLLDPSLVGAAVAGLHRVAPPAVGPVEDWYAAPVGAPAWDDLVARLASAGAPFADELGRLRGELVALESWLEPPTDLVTCHRDLWADNLLPTVDGGVCVLDWDNCGPAARDQELACVLFEFARGDAGRASALVEAYAAVGGPARVTRRGDFSMLVAQLGHIVEIGCRDWLAPTDRSPTRDDAEAWVRQGLDDPHTRAVLDALLVAVRP